MNDKTNTTENEMLFNRSIPLGNLFYNAWRIIFISRQLDREQALYNNNLPKWYETKYNNGTH